MRTHHILTAALVTAITIVGPAQGQNDEKKPKEGDKPLRADPENDLYQLGLHS